MNVCVCESVFCLNFERVVCVCLSLMSYERVKSVCVLYVLYERYVYERLELEPVYLCVRL